MTDNMDNLSYAEISCHALLHNTLLYRLGIHRILASQCLKADNLHDKKKRRCHQHLLAISKNYHFLQPLRHRSNNKDKSY